MHARSPLGARAVLCLVTDRARIPHAAGTDGSPELVDFVREAARAGVDLIQIRERDLASCDLYELVCECVKATAGTDAYLVVNDRFDVALAAGAAGVHLRSDSLNGSRVRAVAPTGFLIGRSVHGPDEAVRVVSNGGLDYLIAGTVFPTPSKRGMHEYLGLEGLRQIVRRVELPVLAIGGVRGSAIGNVAASGAAGLAAIGLFVDARAEGAALAQLVGETRREFDRSRSVS